MTIKEQLYDIVMMEENYDVTSNKCESIVEDVSSRFIEWLFNSKWRETKGVSEDNKYWYSQNDEGELVYKSAKDLFELFKKENNL